MQNTTNKSTQDATPDRQDSNNQQSEIDVLKANIETLTTERQAIEDALTQLGYPPEFNGVNHSMLARFYIFVNQFNEYQEESSEGIKNASVTKLAKEVDKLNKILKVKDSNNEVISNLVKLLSSHTERPTGKPIIKFPIHPFHDDESEQNSNYQIEFAGMPVTDFQLKIIQQLLSDSGLDVAGIDGKILKCGTVIAKVTDKGLMILCKE